jgi:hypothetical protein
MAEHRLLGKIFASLSHFAPAVTKHFFAAIFTVLGSQNFLPLFSPTLLPSNRLAPDAAKRQRFLRYYSVFRGTSKAAHFCPFVVIRGTMTCQRKSEI